MPFSSRSDSILKIRYRRLLTYERRLKVLDDKLRGELNISAAIRGMASVWDENYSGEGSLVRPKWRQLRARTNRVRRQRGYPAQHPILIQSGNLRKAAITHPMSFTGRTMNRTTPGSGHPWSGGPTNINIRTARNRGTLRITGDKVANNYGGLMFGRIPLPRRQFWFVNKRVRDVGAQQMAESLQPLLNELVRR